MRLDFIYAHEPGLNERNGGLGLIQKHPIAGALNSEIAIEFCCAENVSIGLCCNYRPSPASFAHADPTIKRDYPHFGTLPRITFQVELIPSRAGEGSGK